ncbi:AN1-type zinc finger protein 4-like, partial [Aphis craccivora]
KEILEDAPPGSKLAVLIFREGEVINLLRVIENSDGSLTNLKESSSLINVEKYLSRKLSTVELPKKKKSKPSVENNTTYLKMMLLKHNLETLSISSKSKLKRTKPEHRKSASAPEKSQMKTEKDSSKLHTWRLPIVQSTPVMGKYVRSAEFSRIPVLPTIASTTCSEKNAKSTTTRQLCHIMNEPRHTGSTSSIDSYNNVIKTCSDFSISESGTDIDVSSTDWSRRPSSSSLVLSHNIHINVSRQASPTEQMTTMSLSNNTGLGAIHRILNRSDMPIQLDDDEEPMESESNRVEKKSPAIVPEDLNQTVPDQVVEKKKKRCAQCNKKLTISAQYTCRCGLLFCPVHSYNLKVTWCGVMPAINHSMYSESHNCSYDYQKNGRNSIEKNNPLVVREKLPKI